MKIKTFEQACKALSLDANKVIPDISAFPEKHQKALIATAKLYIITEALNEGWVPDWNNFDEYKWFQWWDMEKEENNPSCFRFYGSGHCLNLSQAGGGARLCFKTKALCEHATKHFEDLYRDMMIF